MGIPLGAYRTEGNSRVLLTIEGCAIDWDWSAERNACCDCANPELLEDGPGLYVLRWGCERCGGGHAVLHRQFGPCCHRDHDGHGNCDEHRAPGWPRIGPRHATINAPTGGVITSSAPLIVDADRPLTREALAAMDVVMAAIESPPMLKPVSWVTTGPYVLNDPYLRYFHAVLADLNVASTGSLWIDIGVLGWRVTYRPERGEPIVEVLTREDCLRADDNEGVMQALLRRLGKRAAAAESGKP